MGTETQKPRVVVVGAGFGGLTFCENFCHNEAHVTLVDRQNHHLFQPLLYQVASAGLSAPSIAQPIRSILSDKPNITVLMDEAQDFDLTKRQVKLTKSSLAYDYLVVAAGSETSYFGHPEWEKFAPGLKTLDDALQIRRRILLAFEKAEDESHSGRLAALLTIVVVGGGPTGLELAGTFAELARFVLRKDFRHIDSRKARIILIEGGPRLLPHMPPHLSAKAKQQLKKLGVEVRTDTKVKAIHHGRVETDGEEIVAENIIWAAGVAASPLAAKLGKVQHGGRIKVDPDLSLPGHPEVFVIGDMAEVMDKKGKPVPGVSPAAMQMARHVSGQIKAQLKIKSAARTPFVYWDKGTMSTIGRSAGVAKIGKLEFSGALAWWMWLGVHLVFLIGFRNKISVLFQWAYSYLTYKRGARIITGVGDVHAE